MPAKKKESAPKKEKVVKPSKKKSAKTLETIVSVIFDESGSMSSCANQVISSFNEYKNNLIRENKGKSVKISLTLTKFSDDTHIVYSDKSVEEVEDLTDKTYVPSGMTALNDAIGKTIRATEKAIGTREDVAVLCIIITDGGENSSREYTREAVHTLLKGHEDAKTGAAWTFVYLGANQDAFLAGQSLGISASNTQNFATRNMVRTMSSVASATLNYIAKGVSGISGVSGLRAYTNFFEDTDLESKGLDSKHQK